MSQENDAEYKTDTDEVLAELAEEGFEIEGKKPETPNEPEEEAEEPVVEEETTTEAEPVATEEVEEVNRASKEPTMIPAWKAKIADKKQNERIAELEAEIEASKAKPAPTVAPTQSNNDIKELASSYGLDLDANQQAFFEALASKGNSVPDEVVQNIQAFQQQQKVDSLESQYSNEFNNDVLPLIKEQYGDLPESQLTSLRQKLHDKAFSDTYAKVPLSNVFRAEAHSMDISTPKGSIVTNKSGKTRGTSPDFSNMSEADFNALDGDGVDSFMEDKSGNQPWSRR